MSRGGGITKYWPPLCYSFRGHSEKVDELIVLQMKKKKNKLKVFFLSKWWWLFYCAVRRLRPLKGFGDIGAEALKSHLPRETGTVWLITLRGRQIIIYRTTLGIYWYRGLTDGRYSELVFWLLLFFTNKLMQNCNIKVNISGVLKERSHSTAVE